jgi:myosin-5
MADKLEVYTKDTKAWFPDNEEGYISATLVEKVVNEKSVVMRFRIDGTEKEVLFERKVPALEKTNYEDLPPLKNPPQLVLEQLI